MTRAGKWFRSATAWVAVAALVLGAPGIGFAADGDSEANTPTTTPIKHVVAIFQENVSFDHYFGTYPDATNPPGEPAFQAKDDTPRVNNLVSSGLLTANPNGANPVRIDRTHPNTCDQDHNYGDEQQAFDGGLMDKFLLKSCNDTGPGGLGPNSTMDYYDGNTVTAVWNYAQFYAMSDNHYGTTFGPSTPGVLNLLAGNTFEGTITNGLSGSGFIANGATAGAVIGDADPANDMCSNPKRTQITMSGENIGNLLEAKHVTWGSFMGGFTSCTESNTGITGLNDGGSYIPHHAFFEYWLSTSNSNHLPPTSVSNIGKDDQANHQYDLSGFAAALSNGNLPAVSFIKAPAFEDGHAGYSDPIDEQLFLVNFINMIQKTPVWKDTAILITWDDSDGWYDHQMGPIVRQSDVTDDQLLGPGSCASLNSDGSHKTFTENGRCGFGPRIPLLVISPWVRRNYVDHKVVDQSSIIRFIEDNWDLGQIGNGSTDAFAGSLSGMFDFDGPAPPQMVILDPNTGLVVSPNSPGPPKPPGPGK